MFIIVDILFNCFKTFRTIKDKKLNSFVHMNLDYDIVAIGGGPASFFACIRAVELNPELKIVILEQSKSVLNKVRISGGGRCNVTHACFDPKELTQFYPRGNRELLGPFHTFMTGDTMAWFEERGVELKIEDDNRVFPVSDNSLSIINCLLDEAKRLNIDVVTQEGVTDFNKIGENWKIETKQRVLTASKLLLGTGSTTTIWNKLETLGHEIVKPVPSLFTFNIQHELLEDLPGLAFQNVEVKIVGSKFVSNGPLLITHWGLSAPSILKLSAEAARYLAELNYRFEISINLAPQLSSHQVLEDLSAMKKSDGAKLVSKTPMFDIPKRFWIKITSKIGEKNWADLKGWELEKLQGYITELSFKVNGKSTFKDEFVTSGGVSLKEINFKSYESKLILNLYMVGEMLDIDAVTGGFNFQACWTGGYIAGSSIGSI